MSSRAKKEIGGCFRRGLGMSVLELSKALPMREEFDVPLGSRNRRFYQAHPAQATGFGEIGEPLDGFLTVRFGGDDASLAHLLLAYLELRLNQGNPVGLWIGE